MGGWISLLGGISHLPLGVQAHANNSNHHVEWLLQAYHLAVLCQLLDEFLQLEEFIQIGGAPWNGWKLRPSAAAGWRSLAGQ